MATKEGQLINSMMTMSFLRVCMEIKVITKSIIVTHSEEIVGKVARSRVKILLVIRDPVFFLKEYDYYFY